MGVAMFLKPSVNVTQGRRAPPRGQVAAVTQNALLLAKALFHNQRGTTLRSAVPKSASQSEQS